MTKPIEVSLEQAKALGLKIDYELAEKSSARLDALEAEAMKVLNLVLEAPGLAEFGPAPDPALSKVSSEIDVAIRKHLTAENIWCFMYMASKVIGRDHAREIARYRHLKSARSKMKVFEWCDNNMHLFKSMDAAALDIAETFIPEKFRTVRDYMTEWKKLRSARKP